MSIRYYWKRRMSDYEKSKPVRRGKSRHPPNYGEWIDMICWFIVHIHVHGSLQNKR